MSFPQSSPAETRWVAFIFGMAALLLLLFGSYSAIRSELTKKAIYASGPRGMIKEQVTKESNPVKFRDAVNQGWFMILVTGGLSWVGFYFFRRLS